MSDNLFLFANNNEGTAENLGYYRLYNMKIDGDSEGVESGIDYVDCLIGDGASYIDTGMSIRSGYKVEVTFMSTVNKVEYINSDWCAIFGCSNAIGYTYDSPPYGISAGLYSTYIAVKNNGQTIQQYANISNTCYNKKYTLSLTAGENNTNPSNVLVFANNNFKESGKINPYPFSYNYLRIYDFKIYNTQETLIQHLKPCLDEEGIPCMYDEISGEYFHNQGSGTFGYKKKLRDFQPVLDSNGVPCLMDKINKKYYYDKNGNLFGCAEQSEYKRVEYLEGDGNSYLNIGDWTFDMNTRVEVQVTAGTGNVLSNTLTTGTFYIARIEQGSLRTMWNGNTVFQGGQWFGSNINKAIVSTSPTETVITHEGTDYTSTSNITSFSANLNLQVFGQNAYATGAIKVHYLQIYQSDELVFDGIPVLDNNNTPCMYDLVTETFFYNQGTGEFSYGIEEEECPKVANAIDYIKKISRNNSDYFRTKNFNGLINENLIIKTKIALGSLRDNNGAYFQIVGQYNMNRLYLGYNKNNNQLEYAFFGANDSVTLTDYDVFNDEVWEIELSKNGLTVNGVFIKSLESDITGTSLVVPLYIFQTVSYLDKPNGNILPGQKIYELIFEQDGQIIANFQPCLDDNENLCFCDIVDNTYYYLTLGTSYEYNQLLQTPIKYIETNGTQYIDTGVVPTDNTDIDMVASACDKEYTQVEYLQSDGASYIDTGIYANPQYKIETTISDDTQDNYENFFGVDVAGLKTGVNRRQNNLMINLNYNGATTAVDYPLGKHKIYIDANKIYIDDVLSGTASESTNTTTFGKTMLLWTQWLSSSTTSSCSTIKIHYFKMWNENNELVFDGITVLDNEGTPCMYDLVTETFFYNQGTGTFTHGNVTDRNYLMNDFYTESTYKYKETNTNVEPNLTASDGATLTLGSTYMAYLSDDELEQATKNGWIIE